MRNRSSGLILIIVPIVLALLGGIAYIAYSSHSTTMPPNQEAKTSIPTSMPSPTVSDEVSTSSEELFTDPHAPIYEPGKGFTPDAQRIIDITTLRIGLEKYQYSKGSYPESLQDILPEFAPMYGGKPLDFIPTDPDTRRSYDYNVSTDNMSYQLSATLSSGKKYTISEPRTP